jgi:hypothetical protein
MSGNRVYHDLLAARAASLGLQVFVDYFSSFPVVFCPPFPIL